MSTTMKAMSLTEAPQPTKLPSSQGTSHYQSRIYPHCHDNHHLYSDITHTLVILSEQIDLDTLHLHGCCCQTGLLLEPMLILCEMLFILNNQLNKLHQ